MVIRTLLKISAAVIISTALTGQVSYCQSDERAKAVFGIKGGSYSSGTIKIDDTEYETRSGYCFGAFLDYPATEKLYTGITIDISDIRISENEREPIIDIGVTLKGRLVPPGRKLFFQPGVGIGFAFLKEVQMLDASRYITITFQGEIIYRIGEKTGLLGEVGFLLSPLGGDGDHDVTGGPFTLVRAGFAFY